MCVDVLGYSFTCSSFNPNQIAGLNLCFLWKCLGRQMKMVQIHGHLGDETRVSVCMCPLLSLSFQINKKLKWMFKNFIERYPHCFASNPDLFLCGYKSSDRQLESLGLYTCGEDAEEAPGSWFWSVTSMATVAVCEANQQMEDALLVLPFSSSLCNSVFQVNKIYLFKLIMIRFFNKNSFPVGNIAALYGLSVTSTTKYYYVTESRMTHVRVQYTSGEHAQCSWWFPKRHWWTTRCLHEVGSIMLFLLYWYIYLFLIYY